MAEEYTYEFKNIDTKCRPLTYIKKGQCHLCNSHAKDRDGYPKMSFRVAYKKSTMMMMHKVIYIDNFLDGDHKNFPKGSHVMHKCNNHDCINPKHLYLGTIEDHMVPNLRGEKSGSSKLTEKDVLSIRKDPTSNLKLAKIYKVSDRAIGKIKNRETWTHI